MALMSFHNKTLLHQGNSKDIYLGNNNDVITLSFKDTHPDIPQSGILHNLISEKFFSCLNTYHVPNHFIKNVNLREQDVHNTKVFSFYVKLTNIIHSDYHQQLGLGLGQRLSTPLIDFVSTITGTSLDTSYLPLLDICTKEQAQQITTLAHRISDILSAMMYHSILMPASMHLKFGLFQSEYSLQANNTIMLIDELTPNNMFFWHKTQQRVIPYDMSLISILSESLSIDISRWQETPVEPTQTQQSHKDTTNTEYHCQKFSSL